MQGRRRRRRRKDKTADPANVFGRVLSPDTGRELSSVHFTDFRSSNTDPQSEEPGNTITGRMYPGAIVCANLVQNGGESTLEPYVGQEFDTPDDASEFYNLHASRVGFKTRIGQLYRSRVDGSVSNRRFVCSKEGFQINTRTGCQAFLRVKRCDSGKWVVDKFIEDHNHDLEPSAENHGPVLQHKSSLSNESIVEVARKPRNRMRGFNDGSECQSSVANAKIMKIGATADDGQSGGAEPCIGLEFNTANEAYQFYSIFAMKSRFRVRIGQLFRSKHDGSVTSRRFVCSKEGFQHPSRVGCGAFMRVKKQDNGTWVVDRYQIQHNHELEAQIESSRSSAAMKLVEEQIDGGEDKGNAVTVVSHGRPRKVHQKSNIESDWYPVLLDYFQTRQAEDMGFFYAVETQMGHSRSLFWADGRSRFACTQFGDAIVFDSSYRSGNYSVPFVTFTGVNHHRQPVLFGCALLADESKESFTWLFQSWIKAMSGRHPRSIIADQDKAIREAIAYVFPRTHHCFSMWQIKEKERELFRAVTSDFKYEYDKCIYQSLTTSEFDTAWTALLHKYDLRENPWMNEMYEHRENWVPLYLRGTFFAGIPFNGTVESFFGVFLNAQTPLGEFVARYEQVLEQRREDERKEDYNSFKLQVFLQTNEPVEEQCRRLYTLVMFKVFQKELMQSYSYLASNIYEGGSIARYLVRKCNNENEKHIVTFNAFNLEASCGCQMFESEGMLCRHVLRLFQILDVREIPSRYILHRWSLNAEFGIMRDLESGGSNPQELKAMMAWSLREMSSKYIESGTSSFDKYKLACELMRDGGRKLCLQR